MKDLVKKIKPYWVYCLTLLGGAIMPFAFAPYRIGIAAILSPAILLWCLAKRKPRPAFIIGLLYGLGMFGLGVNWVYVSIHDYGYTSAELAALITFLFVLLMAFYPAFMSALFNALFKKNNLIRCLIAFPVIWTGFEILRGWVFTGFPWLYVGYSQTGNHLRQFAPLGGVWLVTWATVLVSSILYKIVDYYYEGIKNKKQRNILFISMFALWGLAFSLNEITWTTPTNEKLDVALVQGNIPQLMRWDPEHIGSIIQTYEVLTQKAIKANVIVWPEGAIPIPLPLSKSFFERVGAYAKSNQVALFSGVPVEIPSTSQHYNAIIGVGLGSGLYSKVNLVPFGDYLPLEQYLRGLIGFFDLPMSSFVRGAYNQPALEAKGFAFNPDKIFRFAPLVCYEIAYPNYVQQMSKKADFILTVSNDTWFGTSIGPEQHLEIARFRALETGKYVIRATNSGLTAIISPNNEIVAQARQFETTVLFGTIAVMQGQTPWEQFGILPLAIAMSVVFISGLVLRKE